MSDTAIINRIMHLSGPMPDAEAHRRYLRTLTQQQLLEREKALQELPRLERPTVQFWGLQKNRAYQEVTCPV